MNNLILINNFDYEETVYTDDITLALAYLTNKDRNISHRLLEISKRGYVDANFQLGILTQTKRYGLLYLFNNSRIIEPKYNCHIPITESMCYCLEPIRAELKKLKRNELLETLGI